MRRLAPLVTFLTGCAFTLVLLARCGVDTAKAGDGDTSGSGGVAYRSGTRLKAIVRVTPDGARLPTGRWWDSELNAECQMKSSASEGVCVPSSLGGGGFVDDQCTQMEYFCKDSQTGATMEFGQQGQVFFRFGPPKTDQPVREYVKNALGQCVVGGEARYHPCVKGEDVSVATYTETRLD